MKFVTKISVVARLVPKNGFLRNCSLYGNKFVVTCQYN